MKRLKMERIMRILAVVFLAVCASANSAELDADIVAKLEKMVASYPSLVDAQEPTILRQEDPDPSQREWYRRKIFVTEVAYDVRRTDSLVSPYSGTISYLCNVRGDKGPSEESVKSSPDTFRHEPGNRCIASYAYQSAHWRFKSVACQSSLGRGGYEPVQPHLGITYFCQQALPSE